MDPIAYLRGIKRHWRLVAGVLIIALVGAWASTAVGRLASGGKSVFTATTTLLPEGGSSKGGQGNASASAARIQGGSTGPTMQTIAALATVDQVAEKVAKELEFEGDAKQLSSKVQAIIEQQTGFLKISARAGDAERAKQLADSFAKQLLAYLVEREKTANTAEANALQAQIARIRQDIKVLDKEISRFPQAVSNDRSTGQPGQSGQRNPPSPADAFIEQRDAALRELGDLSQRLQEVKSRVADAEGLSIVQSAKLTGAGRNGIPLPNGLGSRLALAAVLGLLGGVALALLRERMDKRIRTKEAAERHFGFPVIAEIPPLRGGRNGKAAKPGHLPTHAADAFRLLGAGIDGPGNTNGSGPARHVRPRAILVTSAGPAEGKTSVAANLAATIAELGRTVTVLSCDFRRPDMHRVFGIPNDRGLTEALRASNGGPVLNGCIWYSSVTGVWVVPSGATSDAPDHFLASPAMRRVLIEARQHTDMVIIDTSPILTSDVTHLLPQVDGVLVVARAGRSSPELAERSSELLKRLDAPVLGVVLTGGTSVALPKDYYRKRSLRALVVGSPRTLARVTVAIGRALPHATVVAARVVSRAVRHPGWALRAAGRGASGLPKRIWGLRKGIPLLSRRAGTE